MASPGDGSLVNFWRAGDQHAAEQIFDRYVDRLVALARRRLSQRMARRVDPEDIVQSVFRTFFVRAKAGQFTIQNQDDLCKLLYRLTVRKTLRQVSFHKAAKRDVGLDIEPGKDTPEGVHPLDQEPTPEAVSGFLDQMEHFLTRLKPQEREILEMRMQGCSTEEIAKKLGTYDRKIYRTMERIRGLAEQEDLSP
jgi:RNA polymerase sigma factor (sigma-70 family)